MARVLAVIVAIACVSVGTVFVLQPRTRHHNTVLPLAYVDHWHAALGVYDCDRWLGDATGTGRWLWPATTLEGKPARAHTHTYAGLHSHDDGVIHIEPASDTDAGKRATLGRYFTYGGWKLHAKTFEILGTNVRNGERCGDAPAVVRWSVNGVEQHGDPSRYKLADRDVIVVAFVPATTSLSSLGAPPSVRYLGLQPSTFSNH